MKRILFVDDEPHVLDGLRDLLRRERRNWDMVFALGGEAALAELDAQSFDVVVSDMRMPSIDGAALLGLVRERCPHSVRIVLSGQTELQAALRAVPVAHQFLAKPCDRDELRRAIERASVSQELLTDDAVRRAVAGAEALPSAPSLYTRLTAVAADPDTTMDDVAALVESDVAMCAKVLQLVNSSFFGLGRQIVSPREAVSYLGMAPLRALVLSAGAFQAFAPARSLEGFSLDALEVHSGLVARVASGIVTDRRHAEQAYAAGMLHDIGKLVLASHRPGEFVAALDAARDGRKPLHAAEHERFGVTHAEIGAYLLTLWGLPHGIVEAVAHHHAPDRIESSQLDPVAAVYIANVLVHEQESGDFDGALDLDYLAARGVEDRLEGWRALAAERVAAADRSRR